MCPYGRFQGAGDYDKRRRSRDRGADLSRRGPTLRVAGILRANEDIEGEVKGMSNDIADRVKKIVVEHLGVEEAKVSEGASFIDDLGADSLDTVELVMAFEEEFGCEIPDDAAEKIVTVKDAIDFIQEHA